MLLPPDLRDWVPDDDMVHFVIEAITGVNLPTPKINRRGCGSGQYPPKMMLQSKRASRISWTGRRKRTTVMMTMGSRFPRKSRVARI